MSDLTERIEGEAATASRAGQHDSLMGIAADVAALEAKVARVEALLVTWDDDTLGRHICWPAVSKIRAALANPRADHERLAADDAARAAGGAA